MFAAFPSRLLKPQRIRKSPTKRARLDAGPVRRVANEAQPSYSSKYCDHEYATKCVPSPPPAQGPLGVDERYQQNEPGVVPSSDSPRKRLLKRKLKTLHQKLRRREQKIKTMTELLKSCSNKQLIDHNEQAFLDRNFGGMNLQVIKNEFSNRFTLPKGRRYSDPVKEFAMTLYYYSPKAYNYVRGILHLPHQSSLQNWCQSVNCQPGFLSEVFTHLKAMVTANSAVSDCALFVY